jgi:hypothetical protein
MRVFGETRRRRAAAFALLLCAGFLVASAGAGEAPPAARKRLVAIPDLHGDLKHAKRSFQLGGVSDDGETWSTNANAHLVQTGDVIDRGDDSVAILKLLAAMRSEARRNDLNVTLLLGNHELLTLQGDYRYVSRDEITKLGKESLEDPAKHLGGQEMGTGYGLRAYWRAGQMAWRVLFSPGQPLGAELRRNRPLSVVAGEGLCLTLFSHAGVRLEHLKKHGHSLTTLNEDAARAIDAVSEYETVSVAKGVKTPPPRSLASLDIFDTDSSVWNRFWSDDYEGNDTAQDAACEELDRILEMVHAHRMVIGHTVQPRGMTTRCSGKLHLIDVGISDKYVGRGAAWTCEEGTVRAHYDGKTVVLQRPSPERRSRGGSPLEVDDATETENTGTEAMKRIEL